MSGPPTSVRAPSVSAVRRAAEPPLRYRWDRISAVGATIVLLLVWVRLTMAESAAARVVPSHSLAAAAAPVTTPVTTPAPATASGPVAQSCRYGGLTQNLRENLSPPGRSATRTVALTFDDGPGEWTPAILSILREQQVPATFFVIGAQVKLNPDLVKQEAQQGNQVGNHSWSHHTPASSTGWAHGTAVQEVDRTNALLTQLTGFQPCLFRPPGGIVKGISDVARARNMAVTLWSVDSEDWRDQKGGRATGGLEAATSKIVTMAKAGLQQKHPIVLLHDGGGYRGATAAALPQIIGQYRSAGYTFVTVGEA